MINYHSVFVPTDCLLDIKEAIREVICKKAERIFANENPGHENESSLWPSYIALRDLYLCLEGAAKAEQNLSVIPFDSKEDYHAPIHLQASFIFPDHQYEEDIQ